MARRWRRVQAAGLVLALAAGLPAGAAVSPGEVPQRTVTYEVRVRGAVLADPAVFARHAARTLNDRRGWSAGGALRFRQVASGGAFTLWLASPASLPTFSSACSAQYSCRVGRHVVINDARWRTGTPSWPAVREYRSYVVNHEVGHWLGLGHARCPAPGAPAPVMLQQSKGLDGCRAQTWPLEGERRAAAARIGVAVRSRAPALVAVDRALAPAAVHVLTGAGRYASALRTPAAVAAGPGVTVLSADADADGVDDLWSVQALPGLPVRVRVLSGASGHRTALLDTATPLTVADPDAWTFAVADADGDARLDLYAVTGRGATGTEVHVLDGAAGLTRWRSHSATALHATSRQAWSLLLGDHDRDGVPDLVAVSRRGGSGRTEVHVLAGAGGFRRWLAHTATPLGPADRARWSFATGDLDGTGGDELWAVDRAGPGGRTDLHVLDRTYRSWVLHAPTALPPTADEGRWSLDLS